MKSRIITEIKLDAEEEIQAIKKKAKADIEAVKLRTLERLASQDVRYQHKLEIKKLREEQAKIPKRYSVGEEIFNSVSHGIGAGLSIAALVLLIVRAVRYAPQAETGFYLTGFTLFGVTLFVLYLMSTLYHALTPYHVKQVFAIFDHSSIYLLIAGTYTPFCLGVLRPTAGWWMFALIWGLSVAGISLYAFFGNKIRAVSAVTYIIMGWLIVFAWTPMSELCPPVTLKLLVGGGIAYTVGCIFYALKKIKWTHCIWHIFVLAGSILHFFSVYFSI